MLILNAALSLLALAQAQSAPQVNLDRKISFEMRAAPAKRILPELSKVAGVRFEDSALTADEVLIIKVDDVSVKDLMAKIAEATAAEWKQESNLYRLIRGPKLQRTQQEAHVASRVRQIQTAQAAMRKKLAKEGPFDAEKAKRLGIELQVLLQELSQSRGSEIDYQRLDSISARNPSGLLAQRIAIALDPKPLVALDGRGTVAFSTKPNRMQFALNREALAAIDQFVRDEAILNESASGLPSQEEGSNPTIDSILRLKLNKDVPIDEIVVQATSWSYAPRFRIDLSFIGSEGQLLGTSMSFLDAQGRGVSMNPPAPDTPDEPAIEIGPLGKGFADVLMRAMRASGESPKLPDDVREVLLNPESHELGELTLSDLLFGIAQIRKVNVLCCPTDMYAFGSIIVFALGAKTSSQFLKQVDKYESGMQVSGDKNWLVLKHSDPFEVRRLRIDRGALGKLVRAASAKQWLSIQEKADFALASPDDNQSSIAMPYLMLLARDAEQSLERENWNFLKLHASLSPTQRSALERGEQLRFDRLTPFQENLVERIVMITAPHVTIRYKTPQVVPPDQGYSRQAVHVIPSERFPDGVPHGATLSMKASRQKVVFVKGTMGQYETGGDYTPENLARQLFQQESHNKNNPNEQMSLTSYSTALVGSVMYYLDVDARYSMFGQLKETSESTPWVERPDQLPPEIWSQIQAELQKQREAAKNRKPPIVR